MSHTQIGKDDRTCISRMLRAGHSLKEIARTIGKDPSAVGRHVNEYGGRDQYDAHEVRRRKRMKRIHAMESIRVIKGSLLRFITRELKDHKSPEQIAGILSLKGTPLATSTIYRYLTMNKPLISSHFSDSKKVRIEEREEPRNKALHHTLLLSLSNPILLSHSLFLSLHLMSMNMTF